MPVILPAENFCNFLKISIIGYGGACLLWALRRTLRLKIIFSQEQSENWSGNSPVILVAWHAQQLMMPWLYFDSKPSKIKKPIFALISKSQDGRFIAKAMKALGMQSVAGSSSRGGTSALVQLSRLVEAGAHVAITPDGPRGPINKVKVGALVISQLTGTKIQPTCFAAQKYWTFNSWDKMICPKPFSKAVILCGETISVPSDATEKEVNELAVDLENILNKITLEAQALVSAKEGN